MVVDARDEQQGPDEEGQENGGRREDHARQAEGEFVGPEHTHAAGHQPERSARLCAARHDWPSSRTPRTAAPAASRASAGWDPPSASSRRAHEGSRPRYAQRTLVRRVGTEQERGEEDGSDTQRAACSSDGCEHERQALAASVATLSPSYGMIRAGALRYGSRGVLPALSAASPSLNRKP